MPPCAPLPLPGAPSPAGTIVEGSISVGDPESAKVEPFAATTTTLNCVARATALVCCSASVLVADVPPVATVAQSTPDSSRAARAAPALR